MRYYRLSRGKRVEKKRGITAVTLKISREIQYGSYSVEYSRRAEKWNVLGGTRICLRIVTQAAGFPPPFTSVSTLASH